MFHTRKRKTKHPRACYISIAARGRIVNHFFNFLSNDFLFFFVFFSGIHRIIFPAAAFRNSCHGSRSDNQQPDYRKHRLCQNTCSKKQNSHQTTGNHRTLFYLHLAPLLFTPPLTQQNSQIPFPDVLPLLYASSTFVPLLVSSIYKTEVFVKKVQKFFTFLPLILQYISSGHPAMQAVCQIRSPSAFPCSFCCSPDALPLPRIPHWKPAAPSYRCPPP